MGRRRRAQADEYAERVNRAVVLLRERSAAEAVRALQIEHGVSERQARRYVRVAQHTPGGVAVPERTVVFTVRLPASLIARVRAAARGSGHSVSATAAEALRVGLGRVEPDRRRDGRAGGQAR
jgi:predicted DNA-binding transcriptional regulator YafY